MFIYKITNKINGKCYIGQTTRNINTRWNEHNTTKRDTIFKRAIKKYGKENFIIEEIDGANSLSELNYLEEHYIYMYDSMAPNGYNTLIGGNNEGKFTKERSDKIKRQPRTKEVREKISKANKGKKRSEETLKKMSHSQLNRNRTKKAKKQQEIMIKTDKGKKHNELTKRKISEKLRGYSLTDEEWQKIIQNRRPEKGTKRPRKKRKPFTEDQKLKMSEACKGRVFTEEHRKKLSEAKKGRPSNNKK